MSASSFWLGVLQKVDRQIVDGKIGVFLQVGEGVGARAERVHEQQRQWGIVGRARRHDLPHDQVKEGESLAHGQQGLCLVQPHRRAQAAVELDDDGSCDRGLSGFAADGGVAELRRIGQRPDGVFGNQPGDARGGFAIVVGEHFDGRLWSPGSPHLGDGCLQTLITHDFSLND